MSNLTDLVRQHDAARNLASAAKGRARRSRNRGSWMRPHPSDSLGVNPEQIPAARAHLRAHGITADFDSEGRCLVESSKQYQQIAKASGMKSGCDGYEPKNEDGYPMLSGKRGYQEREKVKRDLDRMIRNGG